VTDADGQRGRLRQEDQQERCEEQGGQQQALASPRDARAAEQRRECGEEADQPAQERHPPRGVWRGGHLTFAEAAVARGEGPEALARDHHALGARHAAQAWQLTCRVGSGEYLEDAFLVHLARIARTQPPGKCRAAYTVCRLRPTSGRARRTRAAAAPARRSG
jgi:hypothetical protein